MISKTTQFKDNELNRQVDEIVSNQFAKYKEVTVTFPTASMTATANVGFKADRFLIVDKNADVRVWRVSSDNRYAYMQASTPATVTIKFWKNA